MQAVQHNSIGQYLGMSDSIEKERPGAAELQVSLGAGAEAEAEGVDTKLRLPTLKIPLRLVLQGEQQHKNNSFPNKEPKKRRPRPS